MDPATFQTTLPVVANGAALLFTSSQPTLDRKDILNMLDGTYENGSRVVQVLNWTRACAECRRDPDPEKQANCPHIIQRPMHFRDRNDVERLKALMSGTEVSILFTLLFCK
jgi:hypothetical protein